MEPDILAETNNAVQNISIKTERDVKRRLKRYPDASMQNLKNPAESTKQELSSMDWHQEKQSLVNQIVALKAESHQNLLALKKIKAERDVLFHEKQKLKQKMSNDKDAVLMKIKELELKLSNTKIDYSDLKADSEKNLFETQKSIMAGSLETVSKWHTAKSGTNIRGRRNTETQRHKKWSFIFETLGRIQLR